MGASKQRGKTSKKVKQDSFLKKEWRHVFVPGYFSGKRDIGVTVTNKIARGKVPLDYVGGRVWELSHGDLTQDQTHVYRLFKWKAIAAGDDVYTQFAGMRITRDKLASIMRKYRTLINAEVDVKTADGFILRLFSIGFTKKLANSNKKHCYATQEQCRKVRDVMKKAMVDGTQNYDVEAICKKLVEDKIENEIVENCKSFCQIEGVYVTKVKVIKAPALTAEQIKALHIPKNAAEQSIEADRPKEE